MQADGRDERQEEPKKYDKGGKDEGPREGDADADGKVLAKLRIRRATGREQTEPKGHGKDDEGCQGDSGARGSNGDADQQGGEDQARPMAELDGKRSRPELGAFLARYPVDR